MLILLFVVHVLIAIALIGVVLLQKSEGGALGIGGGGGMSGFMTGRSTANLLTRTTAVLGVAFFATSILLVLLSNRTQAPTSILDQGPAPGPTAPMVPTPTSPKNPDAAGLGGKTAPAAPAAPSAPLAK
jgi:preprotein translocase subunit SecG